MKLKKIKLRRRFILLCVCLLLISLFLTWHYLPKSYEITYSINDYKIKEQYIKEDGAYLFNIEKEKETYTTFLKKNYFTKQKLIKEINLEEEENEHCLLLKSDYFIFEPLCRDNEKEISPNLVSDSLKEKIHLEVKEYEKSTLENEKIKTNALLNHTYYLYQYKGFYRITKDKIETIPIFKKDIYQVPLLTKVDDILMLPNYESDYYFNQIYLIHMDSGKVETWNLKNDIYFDSYILGVVDHRVYLFDTHEEVEWEIDLVKKKMKKVSNKEEGIFYDNGWEKKSLNKLINERNSFSYSKICNYFIDNGVYKSIFDQSIKLSNKDASFIVYSNDDEVFYLEKDSLYAYTPYYKEVFIMSNFEWNFNQKNMIFIY